MSSSDMGGDFSPADYGFSEIEWLPGIWLRGTEPPLVTDLLLYGAVAEVVLDDDEWFLVYRSRGEIPETVYFAEGKPWDSTERAAIDGAIDLLSSALGPQDPTVRALRGKQSVPLGRAKYNIKYNVDQRRYSVGSLCRPNPREILVPGRMLKEPCSVFFALAEEGAHASDPKLKSRRLMTPEELREAEYRAASKRWAAYSRLYEEGIIPTTWNAETLATYVKRTELALRRLAPPRT